MTELTPKSKLINSFPIEKDGKSYLLNISCDEKNIIIKCKIEKPLKVYEKEFSKSELDDISTLFKAYENIQGAYIYILNAIENKLYIFNVSEQYITIQLNKYINIEFKEINIPEKEIDISEKVENLYLMNEDLYKYNEELKKKLENLSIVNEDLKKEINVVKAENAELKKGNEDKIEIVNVALLQGSNFGSGFNPFKVYKLRNNLIKLSGLINCTLNQSICQLPENLRPKGQLIFTTMSNDALIRVDIKADGNVVPCKEGNGWLSLDGISFIAGE